MASKQMNEPERTTCVRRPQLLVRRQSHGFPQSRASKAVDCTTLAQAIKDKYGCSMRICSECFEKVLKARHDANEAETETADKSPVMS